MSADGEIEVAVMAEGADDAAADVAEGSQAQAGGPGGGGGDGLAQSLRGGIIGGLIASAFGPVLEVLDPMLEILEAFVAPVMAFLLRLLQPALRFLIELLPLWIGFIDFVNDNIGKIRAGILMATGLLGWLLIIAGNLGIVEEVLRGKLGDIATFVAELPGKIWDALSGGAAWLASSASDLAETFGSAIWDAFSSLPNDIVTALTESVSWLTDSMGGIATTIGAGVWAFMLDLPAMIGRELAQRVPDIFNPLGGDDSGDGGVVEQAGEFIEGSTQINISGGLDQFIERVERESGVDIP
jgi:hypothetical protein